MYDILFQPVHSLIAIKENTNKALYRLGIKCLRDLLFYKPYSYIITDVAARLDNLRHDQVIQTRVIIKEVSLSNNKKTPTKIYVSDNRGDLFLVFFNKIPPFIFSKLKIGSFINISGKVQYFNGQYQITHPDFILNQSESEAVQPVYHLTYGILNKQLYNYIITAIKYFQRNVELSLSLKASNQKSNIIEDEVRYMQSLLQEIKKLHFLGCEPKRHVIEKIKEQAVKQLSFKELFANQFALSSLRKTQKKNVGNNFIINKKIQEEALNYLEFCLTNAQKNAIEEIEKEQNSNTQMMRLIQGDVGCGKTLIALMTILNVVSSGFQTAFMAPTDLLAIQHFQFFSKALSNHDINIALLTGKTTSKNKQIIKDQLKNGKIQILIGTHALFQTDVDFHKLGYVVIDEQHRFGVNQRMELINKSQAPDILVMTATPIPRSLALTIFGDISITSVKDKPKDRLPIITSALSVDKKEQVILSLERKINSGEKIYWVCPLVDQNDEFEGTIHETTFSDVTTTYQQLGKIFPSQVGLLHGKMKQLEKDKIMDEFKNGHIKVLVATSVIEVGIDVPDATLIVIENAENFGLAQLHQLRGRVGRGVLQSYCILIYNNKRLSKIARKRIEIMRTSNDGFFIAEQDLLLRGGGEILGTKQSGEAEFFFADLSRDKDILLDAHKIANEKESTNFVKFQIKLFDRQKQELVRSG
ncbi:MAG TPA: ATP-dependent DNA helicase RecG [Candidatus Megaira endosymbiont of Nemacystus decipiens]|nr:ATP-dependent DNA helicase RecG [Candidatus Megaera endosymbiont of Nemacystus decipiens]